MTGRGQKEKLKFKELSSQQKASEMIHSCNSVKLKY